MDVFNRARIYGAMWIMRLCYKSLYILEKLTCLEDVDFILCHELRLETSPVTMSFAHFLNDLGNTFICRPMAKVHEFRFLHFFDDMGILLVCGPLRYIHRFAEFLVG
jgi:hypothetical protein